MHTQLVNMPMLARASSNAQRRALRLRSNSINEYLSINIRVSNCSTLLGANHGILPYRYRAASLIRIEDSIHCERVLGSKVWSSLTAPKTKLRHSPSAQKRFYSYKWQNSQFGEMTEQQYRKSHQRFKALSSHNVTAILGQGISKDRGNQLLDTIQKQRVTGTLDYDVDEPGVNKARISRALRWLRTNYPLDEDAAIETRIEREEAILGDWRPQQTSDTSGNIYGYSELETRIQAVKKERERQHDEAGAAKYRDNSADLHGNQKGIIQRDRRSESIAPRKPQSEVSEWIQRYREQARLSDLSEPPKMKAAQILIPCTIFISVVVGSCIWFATNYTPPPRNARLFPEIPPAAATICGIVAVNIAVWLMWKIPPFWKIMNRNFLLIPATPNPIAMVGSAFSHHGLAHLGANMTGLWFIGTALCDEIGRGNFLALYIAGGVAGSWLSLVRFVAIGNYTYSTLGASGAVLGIVAAYCALFPHQSITIAFIPENWKNILAMKAEYVLYTLVLIEIIASLRGKIGGIDHAAHLGGLLTGIAGAEILRRQARRRRQVTVRSKPTKDV